MCGKGEEKSPAQTPSALAQTGSSVPVCGGKVQGVLQGGRTFLTKAERSQQLHCWLLPFRRLRSPVLGLSGFYPAPHFSSDAARSSLASSSEFSRRVFAELPGSWGAGGAPVPAVGGNSGCL